MTTQTITTDDFHDVIDNHNIVLIDFWASWCPSCRAFAPIYDAVSNQYKDIVFGKVDVDANSDLASQLSITAIPTLTIIKYGSIIFQQAGALSTSKLIRLVDDVVHDRLSVYLNDYQHTS